jgi:hypothetical protein
MIKPLVRIFSLESMSNEAGSATAVSLCLDKLLASGGAKVVENEVSVPHQHLHALGDLTPFASLRTLDVAHNHLTDLAGLGALPNLKSLVAYCCLLTDIDDISRCSRLETLQLQFNGIADVGIAFLSLKHLRRLRLDKNRLVRIDNLQNCAMLRTLDLSFNQLEDLSALNGLQNLEELRVTNNRITSLTSLRALPSLRELEVDCNGLRSLDGIQFLPTLEVLSVEDNQLSHIRIAASSLRSRLSGAISKSSIASKSIASDSKPRQRALDVGLRLLELNVSRNRIRSLAGLEELGGVIEALDVRDNSLIDAAELYALLGTQPSLVDLNIEGNPVEMALDRLQGVRPGLMYFNGKKVLSVRTADYAELLEEEEGGEGDTLPLPPDRATVSRGLQEVVSLERLGVIETSFRALLLECRSRVAITYDGVTASGSSPRKADRRRGKSGDEGLSSQLQAALIDVLGGMEGLQHPLPQPHSYLTEEEEDEPCLP